MRATAARSPAFEVPSPGGTTVTALGSESCSCGAIILETSLGVLSKVFFFGEFFSKVQNHENERI